MLRTPGPHEDADESCAAPSRLVRDNQDLRDRIAQLELALVRCKQVNQPPNPSEHTYDGENPLALQQLLQNMLNAFIVWESVFDDDGEYVSFRFGFFNDAYARVAGVTAEVRGKDVFEVWPTTERSWVEVYGQVAVTGVPQTFDMYHEPTKGWYHCKAYRPTDSSAQVCVIFEEITERKLAEETQRKLEEQLRVAQKMEAIGRLAGGIAHDFNNLLSVILNYTDFAIPKVEGTLKADLLQVRQAGQRAAQLTCQLLAFSRKQVLKPIPISLGEVAQGIEGMLRRIMGEDIELLLHLTPGLGLTLADPGQIEQVIMNLVVNARDAMPQGGTLTIETADLDIDDDYASAHQAVRSGPYVMLSVTDTGHGMDRETKARIFEPFFTTKAQGKGTGLGLSTVYGIVMQSGGCLDVYSEPNHGTTFKILLPRLPDGTSQPSRSRAPISRAHGSETILMVEDEEPLRRLTERILRASGYHVLVAATGEEALRISETTAGPIHLLLTDVVMPQMSGPLVAEQLMKKRPDLKVVYVSGYGDHAIFHNGLIDPDTHFVSKPFNAADLTRQIRVALDGDCNRPGRRTR